MDDAKNKPVGDDQPVSVKPGGAEREPLSSSPEVIKRTEVQEVQESEPSLDLDNEVKEAGVEEIKTEPDIPTDTQIQPSIPKGTGPNYKIAPVDLDAAEKEFKEEKVEATDSRFWRKLLMIIEEKRKRFKELVNKQQSQQGFK